MSKGEVSVANFDRICRLCSAQKRTMTAIYKKKPRSANVPLEQKIQACASVEMFEGDGLPNQVCSRCLQAVNQCYAFREQIEQTDAKLRALLQDSVQATEETSTTRLDGSVCAEPEDMIIPGTEDVLFEPEITVIDDTEGEHDDHNYGQRSPAGDDENCSSSEGRNDDEQVTAEREEIGCAVNPELEESEAGLEEEHVNVTEGMTEEDRCKVEITNSLVGEEVILGDDVELKEEGNVMMVELENIKTEPVEEESPDLNEPSSSASLASLHSLQSVTRRSKRQSDQLGAKRLAFVLPKKPENQTPSSSKSRVSAALANVEAARDKTVQLLAALSKRVGVTVTKKITNTNPKIPPQSKPLESVQVGQSPLLRSNLLKRKTLDACNLLKTRGKINPTGDLARTMRSQAIRAEILRIKEIQRKYQNVCPKKIKKDVLKRKSASTASCEARQLSWLNDHRMNDHRMKEKNDARRIEITEKIKECGEQTEGDKIYCKDCKIFVGKNYFYNHVKYVHLKVRDHLCDDCGYRASTGHILRQHINALHSTGPPNLACSECDRTFRYEKSRRDHIKSVHERSTKERTYICQFCGKGFFTSHYLRNHIRTHTQETPFKCRFCDRRFSFRWPCVTHERLHTGVKPYKCSFCAEAFTQNCVRKNHEYRAHGNEEFNPKNRKPREGLLREKKKGKRVVPADVVSVSMGEDVSDSFSNADLSTTKSPECSDDIMSVRNGEDSGDMEEVNAIILVVGERDEAQQSRDATLSPLEEASATQVFEKMPDEPPAEMRGDDDSNPLTEIGVAETTEDKWSVIEYLKGKTVASPQKVFCPECKVFLLPTSLHSHIKFRHRKIMKHLCQICGYAAQTGVVLRQHIQAVHVGYTFPCSQCPRKFNLHKRLLRHEATTHGVGGSGGRPCPVCSRPCASAATLRQHLRIHSGEKPFGCKHCDRFFRSRWTCIQHERLHTGVKPYQCSSCGAGFVQNKSCKQHQATCRPAPSDPPWSGVALYQHELDDN